MTLYARCPCCDCHTLRCAGDMHECPLCRWQKDAANPDYSLAEARRNVELYGVHYRPTDTRFAVVRHPILGPSGEYAIDRVALRSRAYIEFRAFAAKENGERVQLPRRLEALLQSINAADRLYTR